MGTAEHAVDVSCRGLRLGVSLNLAEVGPTTGFIEIGQPLPVGSEVTLVTGALEIEGRVMRVREAVEGKAAGMIVVVAGLEGDAKQWWDAQVTGDDPVPLRDLAAPEGDDPAAAAADLESALTTASVPEADAADPALASDSAPDADAEAAPASEAGSASGAGSDAGSASDAGSESDAAPAADSDAAPASDGIPPVPDGPGSSQTTMMDAVSIAAIEAEAAEDDDHAARAAEAAAAGVDDTDGAGTGKDGKRAPSDSGDTGKKKGRRRRKKKR